MNMKIKRALVAMFIIAAMLVGMVGAISPTVAHAEEPSNEVTQYFSDHYKDVERAIDPDHVYFGKLKAANDLDGMKKIVAVVTNYNKLVAKNSAFAGGIHKDKAYAAENIVDHNNEMAALKAALQLTEANYQTYDDAGDMTALLALTKLKLDKIEAETDLLKVYADLTAVNDKNPGATPSMVVGVYDASADASQAYGLAALTKALDDGKTAIGAAIDGAGAKEALTAGVKAMNKVYKNRFEVIYAAYEEVVLSERDPAVIVDENKNVLLADYEGSRQYVETFWSGAVQEVKAEYEAEYANLANYFETHYEEDGTKPSTNVSMVTKGGITVTAYKASDYKNGVMTAVTVFPKNASFQIDAYAGTLSAHAKNASEAINAINKELSASYFVKIGLYNRSTPFNFERANEKTEGGVIYVVTIDLDQYYANYVDGGKGLVGGLIADYVGGVWGSRNEKAAIEAAQEILSQNKGEKDSLCYTYSDGMVEPLNYTYTGGVLMFETTALGNFAVAGTNNSSIFADPLFWLIAVAALILVIIIIKLILKYATYSVKFNSNGGTPVGRVRARKGQYFVMPENPTREGYVFAGWYEDVDLTRRFIATSIKRRRGLVAYAKWNLDITPERLNNYYDTLRNLLAKNGALPADCAIEEGKTKTFAILTKEEKSLNLYLALEPQQLLAEGYEVANVAASEGYAETPALFAVKTRSDYVVAQKLVQRLITTFSLQATEAAPAEAGEVKYVLAISAAAAEEAVEEVVEEVVEEAPVEEEAPAEEEACECEGECCCEEAPAEECCCEGECTCEEAPVEAPAEECTCEEEPKAE